MDKMISLTIDGIPVEVPEGTTVLKAARKANVRIPTLCFLEDINEIGACRLCVVILAPQPAGSVLPVAQDMVVKTNTPQLAARPWCWS